MKKDELIRSNQYRLDTRDNWRAGAIERARGGDGYDVMGKVEQTESWRAIGSWGADGWDLGDWPYVVVYARVHDGEYQLATYCEGDVDVYSFPTRALCDAAIDSIAFFYWKNHAQPWVEGVATADDMPPHLCGPYGRGRVTPINPVVAS